ncbi:hypothetical protein [Pedobacter nutrimenti]|uniref:hypothetical protein n=1 Tax=Pedobacter nutrimenti TaxID=1241337 RepID=UPI00292E5ABE|nr:hypothetical protein [Pedobacter nutrimenti]
MYKLTVKTLTLVSVFILTIVSTATIIPKSISTLSGTWVLDSLQSDLGKVQDACPKSIKINIADKIVSIEKIATNGEVRKEKFMVDGKPVSVPVPVKGYIKISTITFKEGLFEVSSNYTVEKDDKGNPAYSYQRKEIYAVSADGKILTYTDNFTGTKGNQVFKGVYNKDK